MTDLGIELVRARRAPPAFLADDVAIVQPMRHEQLASLLIGVGDEPRGMDPDGQIAVAELLVGLPVEVREGPEPACIAADDREHQRHLVPGRADDRLRRAADGDPRGHAVFGARVDLLVFQWRAQLTGPGDGLLRQQRREQVEFFREQLLVLGQVEPEQRERLDEGTPAENDVRAPLGHGVDRRKALEDPDRIVRGQHGHGRAQTDRVGDRGQAGQDDVGGRNREVGAVMLPHREVVDAHAVGETALLDDVADHLRLMDRGAGGVDGDVAESVEPELHVRNVHGCSCRGECGDGDGAETPAERSREPVPRPVGRMESDCPEPS